ncbi:MAG: hypothetical protein ACUVUQ_07240 [Thermodesulfovibrionales bacterium]
MKNIFKIQNSKLKTQILNLAFGILIFSFCIIPNAYAHKVNIYAYAEDGMVHSESYFVDGSKCKNSILEVFDEKDKTKLLEGKTDDEGKFSFKIPKVTSLKLVLHASMGHQAEFIVGEDEVKEAMGVKHLPKSAYVKVPSKSEGSAITKTQKKETPEVSEFRGISESEIEAVVEGAVDKKIQPVMRMLVKMQESSEKPRINDIIGGIGYIIGILGIIAYFKARRK